MDSKKEAKMQKLIDKWNSESRRNWTFFSLNIVLMLMNLFVFVYNLQCEKIDKLIKEFACEGKNENHKNVSSCKCRKNCCIEDLVDEKETQPSFNDSTKNIKLTDTINEGQKVLDTTKRN